MSHPPFFQRKEEEKIQKHANENQNKQMKTSKTQDSYYSETAALVAGGKGRNFGAV